MMALATAHPHLIDRLPKPRGRLVADAPLGAQHGVEAPGGQRLQAGALGREVLGRICRKHLRQRA